MLAADKPAVMDILIHTPEFKTHEVPVAEEVIDAYLKDPGSSGYTILVAEDGDKVTGYICYGPTPCTVGTWDFYWEAVRHELKGKGIGSALSRAAEEAVRQAGGRLIMIETSSIPLYENTRRFHLRRGYRIVATIPDFYAPGDDKVIMAREP
jgi:predicted N-acetyltransferase YhbS